MFKCDKCGEQTQKGDSMKRIVVGRREKEYEFRRDANHFRVRNVIQTSHDQGGEGWEITKEIGVCPDCFEEHLKIKA